MATLCLLCLISSWFLWSFFNSLCFDPIESSLTILVKVVNLNFRELVAWFSYPCSGLIVWVRDGLVPILTTHTIRPCYVELHLCCTEPDLLQPEILDRSTSSSTEKFLLVVSTNKPGAAILVSGVEEIETSLMSTGASILVDSVGPPRAEVCRTAASFP